MQASAIGSLLAKTNIITTVNKVFYVIVMQCYLLTTLWQSSHQILRWTQLFGYYTPSIYKIMHSWLEKDYKSSCCYEQKTNTLFILAQTPWPNLCTGVRIIPVLFSWFFMWTLIIQSERCDGKWNIHLCSSSPVSNCITSNAAPTLWRHTHAHKHTYTCALWWPFTQLAI